MANVRGHTGLVNWVDFNWDGSLVISGSEDRTVQVWDTITGSFRSRLVGHTSGIKCVVGGPEGTSLAASCSRDKTLRVWDLATEATTLVLRGLEEHVNRIIRLPGTDFRVLSGGDDKLLTVWDCSSGKAVRTIKNPPSQIRCLAALPDGRRVAVGYIGTEWDSTLQIWDLETGQSTASLGSETGTVTAVSCLPDNKVAFTGYGPCIKIWDYETGEVTRELKSTGQGALLALDAWKDGRGMVTGGEDGSLRFWDLSVPDKEPDKSPESLHVPHRHGFGVTSVAISPDGSRVASGGADKTVKVLELTDE